MTSQSRDPAPSDDPSDGPSDGAGSHYSNLSWKHVANLSLNCKATLGLTFSRRQAPYWKREKMKETNMTFRRTGSFVSQFLIHTDATIVFDAHALLTFKRRENQAKSTIQRRQRCNRKGCWTNSCIHTICCGGGNKDAPLHCTRPLFPMLTTKSECQLLFSLYSTNRLYVFTRKKKEKKKRRIKYSLLFQWRESTTSEFNGDENCGRFDFQKR